MSEVYVILIEDRHCDPEVKAFSDKEKAINEGRRLAKEYCRFDSDYEEREIKGYLFYADYSCESDSVSVFATELIK